MWQLRALFSNFWQDWSCMPCMRTCSVALMFVCYKNSSIVSDTSWSCQLAATFTNESEKYSLLNSMTSFWPVSKWNENAHTHDLNIQSLKTCIDLKWNKKKQKKPKRKLWKINRHTKWIHIYIYKNRNENKTHTRTHSTPIVCLQNKCVLGVHYFTFLLNVLLQYERTAHNSRCLFHSVFI